MEKHKIVSTMSTLSSAISEPRLSQELDLKEYIGVWVKTDEDIIAIETIKLFDICEKMWKMSHCIFWLVE